LGLQHAARWHNATDPGAGLTRFLHAHGEQVVELDRPKRAARRHQVRLAGCHEGGPRGAGPRPPRSATRRGHRAALQVRLTARRSAVQADTDAQRQLHALLVAAPDPLRGRLQRLLTRQLVTACRRCACRPPGTPRPPPPRPACAPWPTASSSWRPRSSSTPGPSPPWCEPGGPSCSAGLAWARSWPPSCCAPGPTQAAAAPTPPSPCWWRCTNPRFIWADGAGAAQPLQRPPAQPGPAPGGLNQIAL
jgi:hypothetical protein